MPILIDKGPNAKSGWYLWHDKASHEMFFHWQSGKPSKSLIKREKKRYAKMFNVPVEEVKFMECKKAVP